VLEQNANEIVARLPVMDGVVLDVRRVLASRIPLWATRIEAVARDLAMSPRTLQRRLAAAQLSYPEILDRTCREIAEKYLADSTLSIAEITYLLGYSEPAAFHRAFKRWNGMTPQAFRKAHGPNRVPAIA
jgi:AraC-like DNA-binding protein